MYPSLIWVEGKRFIVTNTILVSLAAEICFLVSVRLMQFLRDFFPIWFPGACSEGMQQTIYILIRLIPIHGTDDVVTRRNPG